jgi:two-component system, NtrC family, response regulator AtoC
MPAYLESARAGNTASLIAESAAMQLVVERLPTIAKARRTTLLCGATGTGKEVIARALHAEAGLTGSYVAVHCGAIPDSLMEAELFGHTRGAFTGATQPRAGLIRSAAKGTLFLDEVDSLSPSAQVKLLRFLETGEFRAVGSDHEERADTWVIAATNRDLGDSVKRGQFRADLMYRLDVMRLDLPSLSARGADVERLANHFLGPPGRLVFSDDAIVAMRAYGWPGNVRELKHVVERAALLCVGTVISAAALGLSPERSESVAHSDEARTLARELWSLIEKDNLSLGEAIEHCEQVLIQAALHAEANNRTRAAQRLGIHMRTIFKKLKHGKTTSANDSADISDDQ